MDKSPADIAVSLRDDRNISVVSQPSLLLEGKEYTGEEGDASDREEEDGGEVNKEEENGVAIEEEKEEEKKEEENKTNKQIRPPPQSKRQTKWRPLLKLDVKHAQPLPSLPHPHLLVLFTSAEISRVGPHTQHHP